MITGASSGLGRASALTALEAGANVTGTAQYVSRFDDLTAQCLDQFLAVEHDVRDVDTADALVEQTVSTFSSLEVLVNKNRCLHSPLEMMTPVEYEQAHYAALNREP